MRSAITIAVVVTTLLASVNPLEVDDESVKHNVALVRPDVQGQKVEILRKQSQLMMSGFSNVFWVYIQNNLHSLNSSSACVKSFSVVFKLIELGNESVPRMLAASGRLPSNLFDGTYADFGNYDQCLQVQTMRSPEEDIEFDGQYCLPFLEPDLRIESRADAQTKANNDLDVHRIDFYPHLFDRKHFLSFVIGLCVPSSCSSEEIELLLKNALKPYSWTVLPGVSCQTKTTFSESLKAAPRSQKISFYFLGAWFALVVAATISDILFGRKNSPEKTMFNCFSLVSSHRALWRKPDNRERMFFLDFIRITIFIVEFIMHSTLWHTIMLAPYLTDRMNLGIQTLTLWYLQPLLNGWAMEGLVILGGMSSAMTLWNKVSSKSSITTFIPIIFKRIYQVWPPLLVIIAMEIALPLFGSGPIFNEVIGRRSESCSRNFIWSILQFTNFVDPREMCAQQAWSIPIELQLFTAVCFTVYLYKKFPRLGLLLNASLIIYGIGFLFYVFYVHDLAPQLSTLPVSSQRIMDFFILYYTRVGSHLWSYFFSLLLTKLIMDGIDKKISKEMYWKWVKIVVVLLIIQSFSTSIWNVFMLKTSSLWNAIYVVGYQSLGAVAWGLFYLSAAEQFRAVFGSKLDENLNSVDKLQNDANQNETDTNSNKPPKVEVSSSPSTRDYVAGVLLRVLKGTYFSHILLLEWYNGARRDTLTTGPFEFVTRTLSLTLSSLGVGMVFYLFVLGPTESLFLKLKSKKESIPHKKTM